LRLDQTLQHLKNVLQRMEKTLRDESMLGIPLEVQKALMEFMKCGKQVAGISETFMERQRRMTSGCTRLNTKAHATSGSKSNAQLDIEHLRFYTRWTSLETAIEHQLVLARVEDCLIAASDADKDFWNRPEDVCSIFEDVLSEYGISKNQFGVSVYVEMRAPEWVANCHHITSPVVPLDAAVALRSRLLHARSTSWESLRTEWIKLLQGGKFGRCAEDAENHVDQARRNFIKQQLPNVVHSVRKALDVQDRLDKKMKARIENKEKRQAEKEATKAAKPLGGKRRRIFAQTSSSDDGSGDTTAAWPYLSAQRLRAHNLACGSNRASATE
jgi:hypothetical protein